ncbi:MAG: ABC transporter ATP-binding protein [Deltaproteobacteria bacterium]|nr:ABC transporter ATP-binding protein [Deltaproteobacteria bacterium]
MRKNQTSFRTTAVHSGESAYLRHYCLPWWRSILCAWLCALALGLVASLITTMSGPAMQLLLDHDGESFLSFHTLFGDRLGSWIRLLSSKEGLKRQELIIALPPALAILASLKALLYSSQSFLWERSGELISQDIRRDLMNAFLHLSPAARRSAEGRKVESDLSAHLTTDIRLTREYFVHFYGGLPRELCQLILMAGVLMALSIKLFLIFFFCIIPLIAMMKQLGKKLKKRASRALSDYSDLTEWLQQRLLGIETIKHYGTEVLEISGMQKQTTKLNQHFLRAARVRARTSPVIECTAFTAVSAILALAFRDIRAGELSGAVAVSFFSTLAMVSQSASMVGRYFNSNREGSAAVIRLLTLSRFLSQSGSGKRLSVSDGDDGHHLHEGIEKEGHDVLISCHNLTIRHPGMSQAALQSFEYKFRKGFIYCITGPSGAGKSTLFQALLGLISPDSGTIHKTKQRTGYMPQLPLLMNANIAENIAYPDLRADHQRVQSSLRKAGLSDEIMALHDGILHNPMQEGSGLSGGQIQRIFLARVFYHDFSVLLFDEGTSALDPEAEQKIYASLKEMKQRGCCIIMIAHRPTALSIADHILTLQEGHLISS